MAGELNAGQIKAAVAESFRLAAPGGFNGNLFHDDAQHQETFCSK